MQDRMGESILSERDFSNFCAMSVEREEGGGRGISRIVKIRLWLCLQVWKMHRIILYVIRFEKKKKTLKTKNIKT